MLIKQRILSIRSLTYIFCLLTYLGSFSGSFANTYVVDVLTDVDNLAVYTLDDGTNTLRKCIRLANANAGADTINFKSSLAGTITLASNLTSITGPTVINGTTALGAIAGTPTITINGNTHTTLIITASNCVINTLCIINSSADGIFLNGGGNSIIKGCYIGVNTSGAAAGNAQGILIDNASNSNVIGGTTVAERNIISGNGGDGIKIDRSPASSGIIITGNYIGVGIDGSTARPNTSNGIEVASGSNSFIGGPALGAGNIISANGLEGIKLGNTAGPVTNVTIQGNYIGTNPSGATNIGNGANGIHGATGANVTNCTIGLSPSPNDTILSEANIIAYNVRNAINLEDISQVGILMVGNGIYCNGSGFTPIDYGSSTGNGNGGVPAPVIISATRNKASGTCISGYEVHIYRNSPVGTACGCSAEIYVGKAITTGTTWTITHNLCLLAPDNISAIQTDPATNNTGLLSTCHQPVPVNNAPVAINDTLAACLLSGQELDIDATDNDSDIDGDSIEITQILSSSGGVATIMNDSTIKYIPNAGTIGLVSISYELSDKVCPGETPKRDTATVVLTINVNRAPVAMLDTITACVDGGAAINVDVTANDSDIDGDSLEVKKVFGSFGGAVTILNDSTVKFIPDFGTSGPVIISYVLCDKGNGCLPAKCDTATISLCVNNSEIFIPNLITPGNDTHNNTFEIKGLFPNTSLKIYNIWGNLVYLSDNYTNTWKPENKSDGVYFYYLKDTVRQKEWKGWLHVLNDSK